MISKDDVTAAVLAAASKVGERMTISCEEVFRLAERLRVEGREIGEICNAQKIKVVQCQLGCFK